MAEKKSLIQKLQALLDERGLRSEAELTRLHKFIHFWVLLGNSFVRNRCPIRASALSYTTLLALIPLLAVAISVTSSLLKDQGEDRIYDFVDQFVAYMIPPTGDKTNSTTTSTNAVEAAVLVATNADLTAGQTNFPAGTNEVILSAANNSAPASGHDDRVTTAQREAAQKIHEFISNIRSGTLGTIGMILLLVVGIRMLGSVESTFNDIWGVTRGRNWLSRVQIYCTTILLGPLLLAGAAALAGGSHLQTTRALITKMPFIGSLIFPTLTLVTLWLTFALFYQLVPNTKVKFSAALIGGIVGGSLWHLNNLFGFVYASRLVTNTNIYGSLALVPVFMAGLYLSWFILLFGAQVAYAFQNRTLYLQEKIAENVNQRGREFIALRLMTCIGQRFEHGLPSATIQEMSGELAIPSRLVQQVLQTLIAAHLVAEINGVEPAYTPARPLEAINAHHVLQAMRSTHGQELVTRDEPVREEVYGEFARIQEAEKQAASTVTMLALVSRAQARLEFGAPQTAGDEIKMKPAFVPTIEPITRAAEEKIESVHSSAGHSPDLTPKKFSQGNVRQGNEDRIAVAETESATPAEISDKQPEQKLSAPFAGQPSTEEERDFPL
jgi:membrane protein